MEKKWDNPAEKVDKTRLIRIAIEKSKPGKTAKEIEIKLDFYSKQNGNSTKG